MQRFEAMYRDEFTFVWSVARHLGVPAAALEDIVQDVFMTAYRRLDHLRYEVSPRAWLFGVTRRVAFRHRRSEARRARYYNGYAEAAGPSSETPQQRHDDARQLDRLLARLSASGRAVWEMTELLGMSAPEIASELKIPLNTVYSRLRLARAQLQTLADADTLDAFRDQARRQDPSREQQQRTWALMLPVLGHGGTGAGAGVIVWVKAQAAAATTMIATGVVVVGVAIQPGPASSSAPGPEAATTTAHVAHHDVSPAARAPAPEQAPGDEPDIATPPAPTRRASARPTPTSEAQARLAEEVALIDRARGQLAADDAAAALATLTLHAQRFPAGILADMREAAHVDVLCRRGDDALAEQLALRLRSEYPQSVVAQRFVDFHCTR